MDCIIFLPHRIVLYSFFAFLGMCPKLLSSIFSFVKINSFLRFSTQNGEIEDSLFFEVEKFWIKKLFNLFNILKNARQISKQIFWKNGITKNIYQPIPSNAQRNSGFRTFFRAHIWQKLLKKLFKLTLQYNVSKIIEKFFKSISKLENYQLIN